ncbi:MAG: GNAT family N-acetyltransferase [Chitinophagaceae bacterium]
MAANYFSSFPIIETKRLLLRQMNSNDVQDLFAFRSNEEAMKYISRPIAKTIDDALGVINLMQELYKNEKAINWGICYKQTNTIIGTIAYMNIDTQNFRAEIGYMLHPDYHRKGIMQEAIETLINFGFEEMQLHSIYANIHPNNEASKGLLLKNSFIQEAHFREHFFYEGKFLDSLVFGLLNNL